MPLSASIRILFLLTDTTAISAPAKNAFIMVRAINSKICAAIAAAPGSLSKLNSSFNWVGYSGIFLRKKRLLLQHRLLHTAIKVLPFQFPADYLFFNPRPVIRQSATTSYLTCLVKAFINRTDAQESIRLCRLLPFIDGIIII